jgi:hypothetical protein
MGAVSSAACDALRQRLAEAELALHHLAIGKQSQSVTFGSGKAVSYTQANRSDLVSYVNTLREQVAQCDATGTAPVAARGPIRFTF